MPVTLPGLPSSCHQKCVGGLLSLALYERKSSVWHARIGSARSLPLISRHWRGLPEVCNALCQGAPVSAGRVWGMLHGRCGDGPLAGQRFLACGWLRLWCHRRTDRAEFDQAGQRTAVGGRWTSARGRQLYQRSPRVSFVQTGEGPEMQLSGCNAAPNAHRNHLLVQSVPAAGAWRLMGAAWCWTAKYGTG